MIFCVEDDASIRELMVYTLKVSGFEVKGFENAAGFWQELKTVRPELVLLDIMLPDEDGLEVLQKLRSTESGRSIPVILATAKGTEFDKVYGLDLGADDYLAKPFGMLEMVSRIKAVLRRAQPVEQEQAQAELVLGELAYGQLRGQNAGADFEGIRAAAAVFGKPRAGLFARAAAAAGVGQQLFGRDSHRGYAHSIVARQAGRLRRIH